jgi:hypothetical protein
VRILPCVAGLEPAGEDGLGDLAQEAAGEEQLGVEERRGHLLVMVEPPCDTSPARRLASMARVMPR